MSHTFENTFAYKQLVDKHSLEEYGTWQIYGEDPNCDFGGHHHEPFLANVEGKLKDVIAYAVKLPGFWQWGAGGNIKKITSVIKVDEESLKERESLLSQEKELESKLKEIKQKLGKDN